MKHFYYLMFIFIIGRVTIFADTSVSPQSPAYLESFSEQQKIAIHRFLSQELGQPLVENVDSVNQDELKQFYQDYLEKWKSKFSITSTSKENQTAPLPLVAKKKCQDCNKLIKAQLRSKKCHCPSS